MSTLPEEQPTTPQYQLPTLVKGAYYWQAKVDTEEGHIEVEHGKIGTLKPTRRKRDIKQNKSGRTIASQCWLEVKQKYNEKTRAGYVTEEIRDGATATTEVYVESIREELEETVLDINTVLEPTKELLYNDVPVKLPMLATHIAKRLKVKNGFTFPKRAQPKANGVRGIVSYTSSGVHIYTRTLHSYYFMAKLRTEIGTILKNHPTVVLDGELYAHGVAGQNITSIVVQKTKPHPDEDLVRLHVFDCYLADKPDMLYHDRRALLETIIQGSEYVVLMRECTVNNMEELERAHQVNKNENWEGTMLRSNVAYEHRRSIHLIKYKVSEEMDVHITDISATDGDDVVLSLEMDNGKTFLHRPEGTVNDKMRWLKDPSLVIGRIYSFEYSHLTEDGIPLAIHDGKIRFDLDV
jgi:ATP-dependent DNA ligase